ncbi:AbiH family protein [Exiguobacterium sp. TDN 0502]|uniref:AbiH family protein n=1 Tax=Exiguobacterium sp. TDN 0502 TaxID=3420731 RepID=UPI003D76F8F3
MGFGMRITYLIGNGLDINLGLKTSYINFYNHLKKHKDEINNSIVDTIISTIFNETILKDNGKESKEKIDWSDFEVAIGKYTREIAFEENDREKFIEEYEEFIEFFTDYIEKNLKTFSLDKVINENLEQFDISMRNPINTYERDQVKMLNKLNQFNQNNKYLNFIIFNYTTIFDDFLKKWKSHYSQDKLTTYDPIHIHGYCQEEILLGVNDPSQIDHEFSSNTDIQMMMVKNIANDYALTSRKEQTEIAINNSDLIIIYGMSLGDSDKYWWEVIINSLKKDRNRSVLIYAYEVEPEKLKKHTRRMQKKQKEWKEKLLQYSNSEDSKALSEQIFIQFNTKNIFNFSQIKKEELTFN